jgi:hypothetical protein
MWTSRGWRLTHRMQRAPVHNMQPLAKHVFHARLSFKPPHASTEFNLPLFNSRGLLLLTMLITLTVMPASGLHYTVTSGCLADAGPQQPCSLTIVVPSLQNCCERVHSGQVAVASPATVLRARFSAYVRGQPQYLRASTHPDYYQYAYNAPATDPEARSKYERDLEFGISRMVYADFRVTIVPLLGSCGLLPC